MVHNRKKKNKTAKTTQNKKHIQKKHLKKSYQVSIASKLMRCSIYNMMN